MWYKSPFKNLNRIQSKQVGAIVASSVFSEFTMNQLHSGQTNIFRQCFMPSLRTIAGNDGVFNVQEFLADRFESELQYNGENLGGDLNSCQSLYKLASASIPVTVSYPYISAEDLRKRMCVLSSALLHDFNKEVRITTESWFFAFQHVLLRFLCDCERPLENTVVEGLCTEHVRNSLECVLNEEIPINIQTLVDGIYAQTTSESLNSLDSSCASVLLILRFVSKQSHQLIDGLRTLHGICLQYKKREGSSKPFIDFVALYCATLIGARFGSRYFTADFLERIPDADLVCSTALSLVQFSWNPNYIQAGLIPQV